MVPGVTKALVRGWVYRSRVQLNPDSGPRRNCHHPGTIAFNFAEHRRSRLQRRHVNPDNPAATTARARVRNRPKANRRRSGTV